VCSFVDAFRTNIWEITYEYLEAWLSVAELSGVTLPGVNLGSVIAIRDSFGRNLGAGKALPGRLRNLLPSRSLLSS
jgi:hypothetical protein